MIISCLKDAPDIVSVVRNNEVLRLLFEWTGCPTYDDLVDVYLPLLVHNICWKDVPLKKVLIFHALVFPAATAGWCFGLWRWYDERKKLQHHNRWVTAKREEMRKQKHLCLMIGHCHCQICINTYVKLSYFAYNGNICLPWDPEKRKKQSEDYCKFTSPFYPFLLRKQFYGESPAACRAPVCLSTVPYA